MRDVILAIALILLTFLPFYMSSSPSSGSVSFVRLDPSKFEPIQGKEGGTLHFILSGDPKTLNPVMAQESTSTAVIDYLFTGLTKTDIKTMRVLPDLAKGWEEKDSGRRYIFHLREGVRWSDGVELTADDVVFTYRDVYLNKDIPNSTADMLRGIIKTDKDAQSFVRKIDRYTVEFNIPKPFAPFLQVLSAPILPKHKLEKYVKEGSFPTAWNVDTDPKEIVGTGPYVIKRYVKGQFVEYSANPYYYEKDREGRKLPYIKSMIGIIVQDPDTALLRFSAGDADYIGVRPQDLLFMSRLRSITLYDLGPTPSTTFLVFNQNPRAKIPPYKLRWFQNRVFRQAISHAIDREGICYLVYNGLAEPLYTPITPANRPYYDEGYYPKYNYDLKLAREMLESIGFKDRDKDGILEDPQGHKLEIVLLTNAGNKERETIGNIIKEDLEKIGVKVIFRPIDFNSLVSRLSSPPYEWEAVIIGLTGSIDPYFGRNVWHSSGTLHMWNPRQKNPQTQWEKQVDELFDKGAQELDFAKRVDIYKKAFLIITQEQPMIFIAVPKSMLAVYTNRFDNFFPTVWGWYKSETLFIK
ncbi:ABC transporter substrate-binding protein [Hydrogenobacter hydrogenophilus]|uniref:Peptide/nickel transport system substrate-binding protein n=1 Tax=Hydrogenobacter hydrogenophilus TaxID=35835 RepID=A0A285P418_9AQUI|nr:ABC transporter substrate-binding protein [Hydrogenobacter hydrogenophilus]SNZ16475.1 peptide/nickel transport system substrate-binding protein [Hydrogenobacter hydrogenophilus]